MHKKILIVAGEASGDLHAGNLVRALHASAPGLQFYGMGGTQLCAAGTRLTHDLRRVSVIGLVEVLGRLPAILRTLRELSVSLRTEKPDLAILVDFPDFNLRLATQIKRAGIPVLWYISPQVWAWRSERIKKIAQLVDHMLVILPFEVDFYRQHGLQVHFVGHPLIDTVRPKLSAQETCARLELTSDNRLIALLPGSRMTELKLHLPHLRMAAELLYQADTGRRFVIPVANTLDPDYVYENVVNAKAPIKVVQDLTYECLSEADCAVVAAGTATLETALLGTPQIIIGRVNPLTWRIWSRYTKLPYYGLPNYILGEKLVTELIQHQASGVGIARAVEQLLTTSDDQARLHEGYARIRERLGEGGASQRAAAAVLAILAGDRQAYSLVANHC
ncbi:MAG: lipid-A-disaccharide synthase [Acidobacteriota bacterium]